MSLRSGRVGVNPEDVNPINGKIQVEAPDNVYTKTQADNKFETKTHAGNTYLTKTEAEALQPINLAVPIPLLNGSALTVETGLQGVNVEKFNRAEQIVLGAKNLVPCTKTSNGIFTVNSDETITADGTPQVTVNFEYNYNNAIQLPVGKYKITGCPQGGNDSSTYRIRVGVDSVPHNWGTFVVNDTGEGADFTVTDASNYYSICCTVFENYNAEDVVFKPMVRLASDPDDSYVPFVMTNKELTDIKLDVSVLKSITADASDFSAFKTAVANL